jgi:hypothetical protein
MHTPARPPARPPARTHAHAYTHSRARTCMQTHARTHTHTRTHIHARTRAHTYARTHACTCMHSHARTHARTHACTCMHSHARTRARAHARTRRSDLPFFYTRWSDRWITSSCDAFARKWRLALRAEHTAWHSSQRAHFWRCSARARPAPGRIARAALRIVGRVVDGWLQRAVSWWCYARIARERQRALAPLRGCGGDVGGVAAAPPHGMADGVAIARAYGRRFARRSEICDDSAPDCGCAQLRLSSQCGAACLGASVIAAAAPMDWASVCLAQRARVLEPDRLLGFDTRWKCEGAVVGGPIPAATSAPGLAHHRHICTGTRSPPPHSAPRLGRPLPTSAPGPEVQMRRGVYALRLTGFTLRRDPCSAPAAQEVRSHDTPRSSSVWQEVRAARMRLVGGGAATASAILFQQVRQVRPGCNSMPNLVQLR